MNPSILVLDEPSAGLDPRTRRTLIKLLRESPTSTHDMKRVDGASVIAAYGLTREIVENEDLLTAHGLEKP